MDKKLKHGSTCELFINLDTEPTTGRNFRDIDKPIIGKMNNAINRFTWYEGQNKNSLAMWV